MLALDEVPVGAQPGLEALQYFGQLGDIELVGALPPAGWLHLVGQQLERGWGQISILKLNKLVEVFQNCSDLC